MVCSFQGGCSYSVSAVGLTSALAPRENFDHDNRIEVCGQVCQLDQTASSASQATCTVPPVATSYSASNYDIATLTDVIALAETISASASDQVEKITDGDLV